MFRAAPHTLKVDCSEAGTTLWVFGGVFFVFVFFSNSTRYISHVSDGLIHTWLRVCPHSWVELDVRSWPCVSGGPTLDPSGLIPAILVEAPFRTGTCSVCFSCAHSTGGIMEMFPNTFDLQNKTRPIHPVNGMSNSGLDIAVFEDSCSPFSLFFFPIPCCLYL